MTTTGSVNRWPVPSVRRGDAVRGELAELTRRSRGEPAGE